MHVVDTMRHFMEAKAPLLGAVVSGTLGLLEKGDISVEKVALYGVAGGFVASLPKLISAISGADATTRRLLANEIRGLLQRIDRLDRRVTLEQNGKHLMQSEHSYLASHIQRLQELLREAGAEAPAFRIPTYEEMLGRNNKEIKALMLEDREATEAGGE